MYAGILAAGLGLAGLTHSEERLALALLLWLVLNRKAAVEEAALVERYGAAYGDYASRVGKFLPRL